jgi:hypothetical protein
MNTRASLAGQSLILMVMGMNAAAQPGGAAAPIDWAKEEAHVLTDHVQLTSRDVYVKAGEAYFSPDDGWVIFQATAVPVKGQEPDPFYAMYVAKVQRSEDGERIVGLGEATKISEPGSANTCGWFDPVRTGMVMFGSTRTRPSDDQKSGFQVGSRKYVWMFPSEMEIVERAVVPMLDMTDGAGAPATSTRAAMDGIQRELDALKAKLRAPKPMDAITGGSGPANVGAQVSSELLDLDVKRLAELAPYEKAAVPVFERNNYDAECSYSKCGRFVLYAHVEDAKDGNPKPDANIYIFDRLTRQHHSIVVANGYDGGPFFSPDDKKICYRSDRLGNDLLQLFVADLRYENGVPVGISREYQVTNNEHVNWAPYFHPSGEFLVYGSSQLSHRNYEVYAVKLDSAAMAAAAEGVAEGATVVVKGLPTVRITHADGADVLPAFTSDGKWMMWTGQRGGKAEGEERASSQLWIARWKGLPEK